MAIRGLYLDLKKRIVWFSPWGLGLWKYDISQKKLTKYNFPSVSKSFSYVYNTMNGIVPLGDKLLEIVKQGSKLMLQFIMEQLQFTLFNLQG